MRFLRSSEGQSFLNGIAAGVVLSVLAVGGVVVFMWGVALLAVMR